MYKTIEAIYKDGKLIPLNEPLNLNNARVLITVLEEDIENRGLTGKDLAKFCGILEDWEIDGVEYQRKIRSEWE